MWGRTSRERAADAFFNRLRASHSSAYAHDLLLWPAVTAGVVYAKSIGVAVAALLFHLRRPGRPLADTNRRLS
jgi:hypothetical protein